MTAQFARMVSAIRRRRAGAQPSDTGIELVATGDGDGVGWLS
jgi:hypothetical protein